MNTVEDRMRDAFAAVDIPDVPVPAIQSLQRRARRHRLNQASGALGSAAVVVMCIFGGMSFSGHSTPTVNASEMQRTHADVQGAGASQWLVSDQTVSGHSLQTATYQKQGQPCITSTLGGGWCQADNPWPAGQVADINVNPTPAGDHQLVQVTGLVPANARSVTVHFGSASATVPAVATPSSSKERFFSACVLLAKGANNQTPIVGVYDAHHHAVAAPQPQIDVLTSKGLQKTHIPGLPGNQAQYSIWDFGLQAIVYRQNGAPCVAYVYDGKVSAHTCAAATPQTGRPLLSVTVPGHGRFIIGDAPTWADSMRIDGTDSRNQVILGRVAGFSDRSFWVAEQDDDSNVIATCTRGQNCSVVQKYVAPQTISL